MPTVILKVGRVSVETQAVANLPGYRDPDRAVQAQVQEATKRGRKLRRAQVAQVVLPVAALLDLARKQAQVLQVRANLRRVRLLSRGGISIASLAKGVLEVQLLRLVQEDRVVLQSKVAVVQANLVVAPSKGSLVLRVVPRPKEMIGSLEALPHMSLASALQKLLGVTARLLPLNIS